MHHFDTNIVAAIYCAIASIVYLHFRLPGRLEGTDFSYNRQSIYIKEYGNAQNK